LKLLKAQFEFGKDLDHRYLALVAGYGSGKTFAFCFKAVTLAALNVGYQGVIMEPSFGMIIRTLLPEMDRTLEEMGIPYSFSKSLFTYTLHFAEGDTKIFCLSAENYRRMAGMNLAFFGIDEADTMKKDIARACWYMGMSRLRKGKVYQGFTTSTPEGFSFLYEFFVEGANADRHLIKGKTVDNPFLPPEFIQSLIDNYPPNLIKAYLEGEFTNLTSGQVYYAFDRHRHATHKTVGQYPNHILHVGQDFNVGKCSSVVHIVDEGRPYAVDEIMGSRNSAETVSIIKQRYPGRKIIMYPDSSGDSGHSNSALTDIQHFRAAGFDIMVAKRNPFVKDRVNSVNALFAHDRYKINIQQCPLTVKALEQQCYNKAGEPDKEHDQDHPNDALGYFIWRTFPLIGKSKITTY
jgi:PBSX family phage terminase large subunit